MEDELREISTELAGSIKREMDLEDLVERLQLEAPTGIPADRTSDYFSDSGASSIRPPGGDFGYKEEVDKIKRESEQQRAQLRVELSKKWQNEVLSRKQLEAHVKILEQRVSQSRRDNNDSLDMSAKARELETALEDARRRLVEERQTKENFEDLLTALRVDLEAHRNQRDNLRDEVVPNLKSQIEGLEFSLGEAQKQTYDFARMQQELQQLRSERAGGFIDPIMEDGDTSIDSRQSFCQSKTLSGLNRSSTINLGRGNRGSMNRSNSLSRSNPTAMRPQTMTPQLLSDEYKALEQQRDALHSTVKYLLRRQDQQQKQYEKRLRLAEAERDKAYAVNPSRKGGYETEVRGLRSEINVLRKRTDDALEQKWQCEKGLAGLAMDLDRSKQETQSLQKLLSARDNTAPEVLSATLQTALQGLQRDQKRLSTSDGATRADVLEAQVKHQLQVNASLEQRLKRAVQSGESDQQASTEQINELQSKLRKLEDGITSAQTQSETAVTKHEEEIRLLGASNSVQLMRSKRGSKISQLLTPSMSPLTPLFSTARKSPRLDQTTSGPGMALPQALKTEYLEHKVAELEKALGDAEKEMEEVVGRMNTAQIGVAELETER